MESMEMVNFIFFFFNCSNKKLKIHYQKHRYFYSFKTQIKPGAYPGPSVMCVATSGVPGTKDGFCFWPADINRQDKC